MQTFFEATEQQKQLAAIGRQMMDFSEYYPSLKGLNDDQLRELNELSHVGNMLTAFGAPYGTTKKDFSDADFALIAKFLKKELDTQRR